MTTATEATTNDPLVAELVDALNRCLQRLEGDWAATREVAMAREVIAKATGGAA